MNTEISLAEVVEKLELKDREAKVKRLREYMTMIVNERRWGGLTSKSLAASPENAIMDSLAVARVIPCGAEKELVDLGSGSGLLGIVLAIACEEWHVTLVESSARKAAFAAEAIGSLGLGNAMVLRARAEEIEGREEYDFAVSRAAGKLRMVAPIALALLKPLGRYVALKGPKVDRELAEAHAVINSSGGRIVEVVHPVTETAEDPVSLVVIEKM